MRIHAVMYLNQFGDLESNMQNKLLFLNKVYNLLYN